LRSSCVISLLPRRSRPLSGPVVFVSENTKAPNSGAFSYRGAEI
jgi:hypothetical protein